MILERLTKKSKHVYGYTYQRWSKKRKENSIFFFTMGCRFFVGSAIIILVWYRSKLIGSSGKWMDEILDQDIRISFKILHSVFWLIFFQILNSKSVKLKPKIKRINKTHYYEEEMTWRFYKCGSVNRNSAESRNWSLKPQNIHLVR